MNANAKAAPDGPKPLVNLDGDPLYLVTTFEGREGDVPTETQVLSLPDLLALCAQILRADENAHPDDVSDFPRRILINRDVPDPWDRIEVKLLAAEILTADRNATQDPEILAAARSGDADSWLWTVRPRK